MSASAPLSRLVTVTDVCPMWAVQRGPLRRLLRPSGSWRNKLIAKVPYGHVVNATPPEQDPSGAQYRCELWLRGLTASTRAINKHTRVFGSERKSYFVRSTLFDRSVIMPAQNLPVGTGGWEKKFDLLGPARCNVCIRSYAESPNVRQRTGLHTTVVYAKVRQVAPALQKTHPARVLSLPTQNLALLPFFGSPEGEVPFIRHFRQESAFSHTGAYRHIQHFNREPVA